MVISRYLFHFFYIFIGFFDFFRYIKSIVQLKGAFLTGYLEEYFPLVVFFGLSLAFGLILMLAPLVAAVYNPDKEKNSAYECGFEPFETARLKFDVRFYLVAILFVIFDLEVAFLFPWAVGFQHIGSLGFWSMMLFLLVLTIGFLYEWKKGALEWE